MTETQDTETVQNRSEILFIIDCKDCNPNGNPLSTTNRPRIDPVTNQAIVTDVRLKRYLRDQLDEDGHGIYIRKSVNEDGFSATRKELIKDCVQITDPEEVGPEILDELLGYATDIRLFGATLSLKTGDDDLLDAINEELPNEYTGPLQFSPGRSLHPVQTNEESKSLTSVIATKEGKKQGGYDLDDHRIRYAVMPFHGVVNENSADNTQLTPTDVKRLDTLCWRAIKNQTNTRSKRGQEPRLYLRVEYTKDSYHAGLNDLLDISDDSTPVEELRSINDVTLDARNLITRLHANADQIETVHVKADDMLTVELDDGISGADDFYTAIKNTVGEDSVHVIDTYTEYKDTLPTQETE